jgi:hypothetical protein
VAYWETRLATGNTVELKEFGWWFQAGGLEDKWALRQLQAVFALTNVVEPYHFVLERLGKLAETLPREVIECIRQMEDSGIPEWYIGTGVNDLRCAFKFALDSGDSELAETVIDIIDKLGARGMLQFRDLIPRKK